jgi:hypothetical protein
MPKLNDTQTILLSAASQRDSHSLYPLPETLKAGARVSKAVTALVSANFAEERETDLAEAASRTDGDIRYGLFATTAGLAAIGIEPAGKAVAAEPASTPTEASAPRATKAATVLELLGRETGATLPDLIAATG